jgi:hypothetical protein
VIPLSTATRERVTAAFAAADRAAAEQLLVERCGDNLPLTSRAGAEFWDRIRAAVLKLARGELPALRQAVDDANRDWRDTLVSAGFAHDVTAHRGWFPPARDAAAPVVPPRTSPPHG